MQREQPASPSAHYNPSKKFQADRRPPRGLTACQKLPPRPASLARPSCLRQAKCLRQFRLRTPHHNSWQAVRRRRRPLTAKPKPMPPRMPAALQSPQPRSRRQAPRTPLTLPTPQQPLRQRFRNRPAPAQRPTSDTVASTATQSTRRFGRGRRSWPAKFPLIVDAGDARTVRYRVQDAVLRQEKEGR